MYIINIAFIISFVLLSIIFGSFAFFNVQIIGNIEISKVVAGVMNLMPMILNVAVMAGIAYGYVHFIEYLYYLNLNQYEPS